MSGVNKAIVIGRLGQDPELKYTPNGGNAVCNFSLATSERFKTRSGDREKEETQWHRIVCWGKTAEIAAEHLSKGREVYIEGKIKYRSYEDKNGVKKYATEIEAQTVQFIGGKNDKRGSDDIPF